MNKTIGVFDSGVGGLSVTNAIKKAFPEAQVIYKDDKANLPYGDKTKAQLLKFVMPIFEELDKTCDIIVIACNTVTTNLAKELRAKFKTPIIGMEPMVKTAAAKTKTGVIAVCATPRTLASERYADLKKEFARDIKVVEPDCKNWTRMIESNQVDHQQIKHEIESALRQNADAIVLGCTHYHWIEEDIRKIVGEKVTVLQPEQAVISQLGRVLSQLG